MQILAQISRLPALSTYRRFVNKNAARTANVRNCGPQRSIVGKRWMSAKGRGCVKTQLKADKRGTIFLHGRAAKGLFCRETVLCKKQTIQVFPQPRPILKILVAAH